jgi:hypothetical protein
MLEPTFHILANTFIRLLIKQRSYLIKTGKSQADPGYISDCLTEIVRYTDAFKYDTDQKMALFWSNHCHQVYALIPGRKAGGHESAVRIFNHLTVTSKQILANPVPWWVPLITVSPN